MKNASIIRFESVLVYRPGRKVLRHLFQYVTCFCLLSVRSCGGTAGVRVCAPDGAMSLEDGEEEEVEIFSPWSFGDDLRGHAPSCHL